MSEKTAGQPSDARSEYLPHAVVGIGASAGGLEAISSLLRRLPADTGMSFVIVSHLDPAHESALTEILSKVTGMSVSEVRHGDDVVPNHVFVIPPNNDIVMADGRLQLTRRGPAREPHMPIDDFLRSLADDQHSRAIAVILSGTGSDGTLGVKAVKGTGGITFAQDETAAHAGMPRSAAASGCIDAVLPPSAIARELIRIVQHPYLNHAPYHLIEDDQGDESTEFSTILKLLSSATGVNFRHYKRPTLTRRIQRRMVLRRIDTLSNYLACIQQNSDELRALYEEVLIQVTGFFRDPESFEALKRLVFPRLLENRPADSPIRIWVAGCATGEEVYSLAIAITEFLREANWDAPVKIFGTDISEAAIDRARTGIYAENIASDVSEQRLRQFFVKSDGGYQINKTVREMCVFARQDVTKDPPFSNLDIVTCRNLLIYLDSVLQSRVIPVFHYALTANGFLMLGGSESIGAFDDLFDRIDKQQRIYRRNTAASRLTFDFARYDSVATAGVSADPAREEPAATQTVQREADRVVLDRYAPAGVVVDEQLRIVQFRGHTGLYLEPAPGTPNNELLQMAREGLLADLQATIEEAKREDVVAVRDGVSVRTNGDVRTIAIEVIPITVPPLGRRFFVLLFEPTDSTAESRPRRPGQQRVTPDCDDAGPDRDMLRITQELAATRSYLQSVIEEKHATNEELKAANEEIVSSNEELQSTNEELETAKEELQATNEELNTVNDELVNRISVASVLGDDLANLIDSTNIPTVVLGHDLRIRRFTPSARRVLNLMPSDIGREISDFKPKINVPDLEPLIQQVLDTLVVQECEVIDSEGHCHQMSIRPYKTQDNRIDGAIITFQDVEILKQRERELIVERDYRARIIETLSQPLLVLDADLRVRTANQAFLDAFGVSRESAENRLIYLLGGGQWDIPPIRELLESILPEHSEVNDFQLAHEFPGIGRRKLVINARRVKESVDGRSLSILLALDDVTDRTKAEAERQASAARVRSIVETAADGIFTIDGQGIIKSFNPSAELMFGYKADQMVGEDLRLILPGTNDDELKRYITDLGANSIRQHHEVKGRRKDGTTFPVLMAVSEFEDDGQRVLTAFVRDVSDIRAAQERALQAERLAAIGEAMTGLAHESRNALQRSQSCLEMLESLVADNPEAMDMMARLQAAQADLHRLYEEVREYAAPIASRTEATDIGKLLVESWHDTTTVNLQRTANLIEPESPPDLMCEVNPYAIRQVFRNLLQNSFAACDDPVEVSVQYSETQVDGLPALRISLTDNGPGLTPDQRQRVFEPFYTTKTKGTGLGMAIVSRIVAAHRGQVQAGRPANGGTEITMTLPREQTT